MILGHRRRDLGTARRQRNRIGGKNRHPHGGEVAGYGWSHGDLAGHCCPQVRHYAGED